MVRCGAVAQAVLVGHTSGTYQGTTECLVVLGLLLLCMLHLLSRNLKARSTLWLAMSNPGQGMCRKMKDERGGQGKHLTLVHAAGVSCMHLEIMLNDQSGHAGEDLPGGIQGKEADGPCYHPDIEMNKLCS